MEGETSSDFLFPPGFRFHPSDEELITHYLLNKLKSNPLPADVIAEIELYNFNPWELPKKALFGEDEWFFFSPRDRKYPNGERPNRTASSGYWKATGTDKPILSLGSKKIGVKKALVFYTGRAPRGIKTNWIMSEYRLPDTSMPSKLKGSMRLDDWVLCRVRQKGNMSKNTREDQGNPNKKEGLIGYFPKIQELSPTNAYVNTNIITELQTRGCQALSTILSAQYIPQVEAPVYEDGTCNANSPFNNIFNMPKVKYSEGGIQQNISSNTNNLEFYDLDQYANDHYNISQSSASIQGPNETTKISRILKQALTEGQQI